jgi:hypothetical protein
MGWEISFRPEIFTMHHQPEADLAIDPGARQQGCGFDRRTFSRSAAASRGLYCAESTPSGMLSFPDVVIILLTSRPPNRVVDHHDYSGFHVTSPEYPIKPQHCGFEQVRLDLLGPGESELSLHF